jgi:superfamily II DNA or RNA helicase
MTTAFDDAAQVALATPDRDDLPPDLRRWQRDALGQYFVRQPRDFTAVATPGAGKTRFALVLAQRLLRDRTVRAVTVVTPTEHLKRQWAQAAAAAGIRLDPGFRNADGATGAAYDGAIVTYAQVASAPLLHRARTEARPTLVILDEIHHGGDALSWGDAIRDAFTPATRRLTLTGTPFRSDDATIPFVSYAPEPGGGLRSTADSSYSYGDALAEGVVRRVLFLAYSGDMRWRDNAGQELAVRLGQPATAAVTAQAWRTALDPAGEWIGQVVRAANERLTAKRREMPDAAGLVIAGDQATARAYALLLKRICGEPVTLVVSDEADASRRIAEFRQSDSRWMVAVRMVSEGVDLPRLAVGVYATSVCTPLYFAQAVGRFVRLRRRGETASIFLPSIPALLALAAELEAERDHVLRPAGGDDQPDEFDTLAAGRCEVDLTEPGFTPLEASAEFDRAMFGAAEWGVAAEAGSDDEADFLGLPGLLDPDQVTLLLQRRQAAQLAAQRRRGDRAPVERPGAPVTGSAPGSATEPVFEQVAALRRRLAALVSAHAARTGMKHPAIHAELRRRCGGPPVARASLGELQARIDALAHL